MASGHRYFIVSKLMMKSYYDNGVMITGLQAGF